MLIDTDHQCDQLRARYRERVFDGGFAAQVLGHQRTFGIENMGTRSETLDLEGAPPS